MTAIFKNRFTETYGTKHPFSCAALAFVGSTPDLAIAACNAKIVGTFAIGMLPPPAIQNIAATIRDNITEDAGPLNINLLTIFTTEDLIDCICDIQPEIVSFHWGAPKPDWVKRLKAAGIKIWHQVGTASDAKESADNGTDAIIAQGREAGGHNLGTLPLTILIPEIVDALGKDTMVLAAGGISDGRSIAAALSLGADAVYVGSRLVASTEANAHKDYKQLIVDTHSGTETVLTSIYGREMAEFNPLRVLKNSNTNDWHNNLDTLDSQTDAWPDIGRMSLMGQDLPINQFCSFPPVQNAEGNVKEMALSCGQGAGLIHSIDSVDQIVTEMMDDAVHIIQALHRKTQYLE